MKRFLILIYTIFACANLFAGEIRIKGVVVDTDLNPVEGAVLTLIQPGDSVVLAKATSEADGIFNLSSAHAGPSVLQVFHLSYKAQEIPIKGHRDTTVVVYFDSSNYNMGDVTVVGKRKTITIQEDGKMVVALENIKGYEVQNIAEVLRKIPGLSVSSNGNLLVYGQNVTVQIDGMNIKADVPALLKSLPAASMSDVEVVSDPGAQYDGLSTSVVNLVTRRLKRNGYTMTAELTGQLNRDGRADAGGGLFTMIKANNMYISNNLIYDAYPYNSTTLSDALYTISGRERHSETNYMDRTRRIMDNLNLTWVLRHEQEISANLYYFYGYEKRESQTMQLLDGEMPQLYDSFDKPVNNLFSGNINYNTGTNLPFQIKASYGIVYGTGKINENMYVSENEEKIMEYYYKNRSSSIQHIVKLDYFQRFLENKLSLGAGVQGEINALKDNSDYDMILGDALLPDSKFKGTEKIFGIYAGLTYRPNKRLKLYIGGRAEYTDYTLDLFSYGNSSHKGYWNALPFASVSFYPSGLYKGMLTFSTNIKRPAYDYMMPATYYITDYEYEKGNPGLLPRTEYKLNFNNIFNNFIFINVYGSYVKNTIARIAVEKDNRVTEYTYDNCVDEKGIGANAGISYSFLGDDLSGQFNIYGKYGSYVNPHNGYNLLPDRKNFYNAGLGFSVDYQITSRFAVNGYVNYMISAKSLQISTNGYASLDLGARYAFLKDHNLVLSLTVNDVFNSQKIISTMFYDSVINKSVMRGASQCFVLSLSYRFGGGVKFSRNQAQDPNNTDRYFGD